MGLKMSQADLNKLLKKSGVKEKKNSPSEESDNPLELGKKKVPEADRQLANAIGRLKSFQTDDTIFFNVDNSKCILYFKDVSLLSNNISLRLGAKKMSGYKSLWHTRVEKLVDKASLSKWAESKEKKMLIEFCYEVKGNFMDFDGKVAAFKAPLDGLVHAGLIYDDDDRYIDLILPKQLRTKTGTPNLIIMITAVEEDSSLFSKDFLDFLDQKDS